MPEHDDQRRRWVLPTLLFASVACYLVGPLAAPSDLRDLYEHDAMTQKYVAVAAEATSYRWANGAAALGVAVGAAAIYRLAGATRAGAPHARLAATGLLVAAAGWVGLALVRVFLVTQAASDVARRGGESSTLADVALRGDGPFVVLPLTAGAALLSLAVVWRRAAVIGWPTAGLLGLAGVMTAVLARSDPLAIVFISPFPFALGFLPLGISTVRRARQPTTDARAVLPTAG